MVIEALKEIAARRRTLNEIRSQGHDVHKHQLFLKPSDSSRPVSAINPDEITHSRGRIVGTQLDRKGRRVAVFTSAKAHTTLGG
jgi:hypothetical protein